MSLGGPGKDELFAEAIKYATDKGVLMVVAAGNDHVDAQFDYPTSNPNVIAVGASDQKKYATFFSNYGPNIKLVAPGGGLYEYESEIDVNNILSLLTGSGSSESSDVSDVIVGEKYLRLAGTSMAAPFVSGTAALVMGAHPEYTADQVKTVLYQSATDIVKPYADSESMVGWDAWTGYGLVNPQKALETTPSALPTAILNKSEVSDIIDINNISEGGYQIKGTVGGKGFKNYSLSYQYENTITYETYTTKNYPIVKDSTTPIKKGVLGTIPKSSFINKNYYILIIQLRVQSKSGLKEFDSKAIMINNDTSKNIKRKKIDASYAITDWVPADVNNDRNEDLIIVDELGGLHTIDRNGQFISNWEYTEDTTLRNLSFNYPIVIKGQNKIVFVVYDLVSYNLNGDYESYFDISLNCYDLTKGLNSKYLWKKYLAKNVNPGTYAKIYLTNQNQIIASVGTIGSGKMKNSIFNTMGNKIKDATLYVEADNTDDYSLADIDNDKKEEIVFNGYSDSKKNKFGLQIYDLDTWQTQTIFQYPVESWTIKILTADLNKDNKIEYILEQRSYSDIEHSGDTLITIVSNSGKKITEKYYDNITEFRDTPDGSYDIIQAVTRINNLNDVNNDNIPEIGIMADGIPYASIEYLGLKRTNKGGGRGMTASFELKTIAKTTKKYEKDLTSSNDWLSLDVDYNNIPELLIFNSDLMASLYIDKLNGTSVANKKLFGYVMMYASPLPIIRSKYNEIISIFLVSDFRYSTNNYLYIQNFGQVEYPDWPMPNHDVRRTNNYNAK